MTLEGLVVWGKPKRINGLSTESLFTVISDADLWSV